MKTSLKYKFICIAVIVTMIGLQSNVNLLLAEENASSTPEVLMEESISEISVEATASSTEQYDTDELEQESPVASTTSTEEATTQATSTPPAESPETEPQPVAMSVEGAASTTTEDSVATTTPGSYISTGDASTTIDVINSVNTNIYNSTGTIDLINSGSVNDDINIGEMLGIISPVMPNNNGTSTNTSIGTSTVSTTTNSVLVENTNTATTTNNISAVADTGSNNISGTESNNATIETGDSEVLAGLINLVNTNITNSNYLIFANNILGDLVGDIILPAAELLAKFFGFGGSDNALAYNATTTISNTNQAEVQNNLLLEAITGENTATGSSSEITTGNSSVLTAIVNEVNTNFINVPYFKIILNVLGEWAGDILNLPDGYSVVRTEKGAEIRYIPSSFGPSQEGGLPGNTERTITNNNSALVTNNLNLAALTGNNTVTSSSTSRITTGDASIAACITNLVNTNIVDSSYVLGVFNICGNFLGNVRTNTPTSTPTTTPPTDNPGGGGNNGGGGGGTNNPPSDGVGGSNENPTDTNNGSGNSYGLSIIKINNTTSAIYPGDSVSYHIVITNTGPEVLRNGQVRDVLIDPNGTSINIEGWDLGDIQPYEEIILQYEMVYSPDATSGLYVNTARVEANRQDGSPYTATAVSTVVVAADGIGGSLEDPTIDVRSKFVPGMPATGGPLMFSTRESEI